MTAGSQIRTARVWQDKKRHLWLMGLIVPTLLLAILPIVWAMNQARLADRLPGAVLDRPDPALHRAAGA